MKPRGVKPKAVRKKMKVLVYGQPGTGKSYFISTLPKVYHIDTERGAENSIYTENLDRAGGLYFHTTDFEDMISDVTALLTTPDHGMLWLGIDPLTTVYNEALDKETQRLAGISTDPNCTGDEFGRNKKAPDRRVRHLLNLLLRLDMNVVISAHAKAKWRRIGEKVQEDGQTFDCFQKLDYLFDLVLEVQRRGTDRIAVVRKTRIAGFPDGDTFPLSYDEIASRYGQELIEAAAKTEELATAEQILEVRSRIEILNLPEEVWSKWLDKALAHTWEEMPSETIEKCLTHLQKLSDPNPPGGTK
jgi:hypothetical protein